jgi:predicted ATPase
MAIRSIQVSNFKSFDKVHVELGNFNVVIGANASGKTNFVQLFKFLRDFVSYGIDNAISMHGGFDYFPNLQIGRSRPFEVDVSFDMEFDFPWRLESGRPAMYYARNPVYKLSVGFKQRGKGVRTFSETLAFEAQRGRADEKAGATTSGSVRLENTNGQVKVETEGAAALGDEPWLLGFMLGLWGKRRRLRGSLLKAVQWFDFPPRSVLSQLAVYDVDPRLSKKAVSITGRAELEEDASNLAVVLARVLSSPPQKRKLLNLVHDLVPYVQALSVERFPDRSVWFKMREPFYAKGFIPAAFVSDGTVNILALVEALFFEKRGIIIIEEPERNVHPRLMSGLMALMRDAAQTRQVSITTHNPVLVRYVGLDNLLLISRDERGFSRVERPANNERVKVFAANELGVDELFVDDLLGGAY